MKKQIRFWLKNPFTISLLIHVFIFVFFYLYVLKPETKDWNSLLVIENITINEEKPEEKELLPEKPAENIQPAPKLPERIRTRQPEPEPVEDVAAQLMVPLRSREEKSRDSLRYLMKNLSDYLDTSGVLARTTEISRFLDFDIDSMIQASKDSTEIMAEILAENWRRMTLSPEELSQIKPREDIIAKQIYRDQGGVQTVPISLLLVGGIKLAKALINKIFKKSNSIEINYLMSITEIKIMNIIWKKGRTQASFIYDILPPEMDFRLTVLREILNRMAGKGLLAVSEGLYENYYEPAISREKVLEKHMQSLYNLNTGTIDNIAGDFSGNVNKIKDSLHKKILLLNQITE